MMFIGKIAKKFIRLVVIVALISSCSGGGGGDGGSSSSDTSSEAAQGLLGARVLNGAIDAAPVNLESSLDGLVQNSIIFAEPNGFNQISTGLHAINLTSGGSPIFTTAISNQPGLKHSLIVHGDRSDFGLRVNLISEQAPVVPAGQSFVRVIHGVTGASQLSVNSVAIADFGDASSYIPITPGQNTILITRAVDQVLFDLVPLNAEEGKAYSIFVAGEFGFFLTSRVLVEN